MGIPVPTLSAQGWVKSSAEKADSLMAHVYVSDKKQTALYGNNVTSIQAIVQKYGHDIIALTQQLRLELSTYLQRYYDTVNVDVRSTENVEAGIATGAYTLSIYCLVTEDGKQYSFGRLLQISNSKLEKVFSLNNDGEVLNEL